MFRTLTEDDYAAYAVLINEFRPTSFTQEQFSETLRNIQQTGNIWIIEEDGEMVATATIFYEKKFIYNICILAHIEDVCVMASKRGMGYGKKIVQHLFKEATARKCYKVTLDCNDANVGFYESCGLSKRGNQMCELGENL